MWQSSLRNRMFSVSYSVQHVQPAAAVHWHILTSLKGRLFFSYPGTTLQLSQILEFIMAFWAAKLTSQSICAEDIMDYISFYAGENKFWATIPAKELWDCSPCCTGFGLLERNNKSHQEQRKSWLLIISRTELFAWGPMECFLRLR